MSGRCPWCSNGCKLPGWRDTTGIEILSYRVSSSSPVVVVTVSKSVVYVHPSSSSPVVSRSCVRDRSLDVRRRRRKYRESWECRPDETQEALLLHQQDAHSQILYPDPSLPPLISCVQPKVANNVRSPMGHEVGLQASAGRGFSPPTCIVFVLY